MRKNIIMTLAASSLLLTSCFTYGLSGTSTGAIIGGTMGSIIGGNSTDSWNGSQIGGMIGTIAGAAVGGAIEHQVMEERANTRSNNDQQQDNVYSQQAPQQNQQPQTRGNGSGIGQGTYVAVSQPALTLDDFRFIDENNNGVIDAGETCRISFRIDNGSDRDMLNVRPTVDLLDNTKRISLGAAKTIDRIDAHGSVIYTIPFRAASRLKNGNASFRIYTQNGDGTYSEAREFSLPTAKKQ